MHFKTWEFSPPNSTTHYRTYDATLYEQNAGPGVLGYTNYNPPSIDAFVESLPSMGVPIAIDLDSGDNVGGKHELSTMRPESQTRVSSYLAFWQSVVGQSNFDAITFAVVDKILFRKDSQEDLTHSPVAYGVEYSTMVDGRRCKQTAYAKKEVILSAGTLQTPQVMMLSVRLPLTIVLPVSSRTTELMLCAGHRTTKNT